MTGDQALGEQNLDAVEGEAPAVEGAEDPRLVELEVRLQQLAAERDQLKDQALRAMADFQNFRKRVQAEREREAQFATERLVTALLPVLDNFERTVASVRSGASLDALAEGVGAVEKQLRGVLEGQKVTRLGEVGEPFDPNFHEALGTVATDELPEDSIAEVLESGYRMGDRVIRAAKVRVAKGS